MTSEAGRPAARAFCTEGGIAHDPAACSHQTASVIRLHAGEDAAPEPPEPPSLPSSGAASDLTRAIAGSAARAADLLEAYRQQLDQIRELVDGLAVAARVLAALASVPPGDQDSPGRDETNSPK